MHNGKTVQSFSTEVIRESICSERTLNMIKDMLLGVVEKGTGKAVHSDFVRIAGKTGTAQIASGGVYRQAGLRLFPGRRTEIFLHRRDPSAAQRLSFGGHDVRRRSEGDSREGLCQPYVIRYPRHGKGFIGSDVAAAESR